MLEFILEIIGELLLQVVLEVMGEIGLQSMAEPFRKPPNPWLASIGYFIFGAIAGGFSLLVFPHHLVAESLRVANLFLTPVVVGLLMSWMGMWRAKHGQTVLRMDRFSYGFLFAFSLALVRYWFAK